MGFRGLILGEGIKMLHTEGLGFRINMLGWEMVRRQQKPTTTWRFFHFQHCIGWSTKPASTLYICYSSCTCSHHFHLVTWMSRILLFLGAKLWWPSLVSPFRCSQSCWWNSVLAGLGRIRRFSQHSKAPFIDDLPFKTNEIIRNQHFSLSCFLAFFDISAYS